MQQICKKSDCTGCEACLNICPKKCISMNCSDEGFNYPEIIENECIDCGLCVGICPVNVKPSVDRYADPQVYAAWSLKKAVRCNSSSGGLFTEFANYFLENQGYISGACFDEKMELHHILSSEENDLKKMRGSKYLQSEIGYTYIEIQKQLKSGNPVFFTGTPCQVAGLYAYLRKDYSDKLLTADLVCHGVPAPGLFRRYFQELQEKYNGKIQDFIFRKLEAWDVIPSLIFSESKQELSGTDNIYQKAFLKSLLHRESCYRCPFACIPRIGDITIADFWGIGRNVPFHYNTQRGVSLLLINSPQGQRILSEIRDHLFLKERTIDEAKKFNPQLIAPDHRPIERDTIYQDFTRLRWEEVEKKYGLQTPPMTLYRGIRRLGGIILKKIGLRK